DGPMTKTLSGKVALVTGGSRGIGAAIARALAYDGADVAISYSASPDKAKDVVNDLLAKGVRAHAFRADQANAKEVEALVKLVVERFGRLDILVNNAGVFATDQVHDRANNLPELDRLFAVNVGRSDRSSAHGERRAHHLDWLGCRRPLALRRHRRLQRNQGRGSRLYPRLGARLRTEGHHGQQRTARPNRHRHESSRQRRLFCRDVVWDCARTLRHPEE